jgi:hypothetical protein
VSNQENAMSPGIENYRVYVVEGRPVVHVPRGEGAALPERLHAHGIAAAVSPLAEAPYDRVAVVGDASAATVQAPLDLWAR